MKINITKNQTEERTGLFKKVQIWEIKAWLELNDEERLLLNQNPDVGKMQFIQYSYKDLDLSPSVKSMTDPKHAADGGWRFVAYSSGEMINRENEINEQAKALKDHLMSLKGAQGTTVREI